MQFNFLTIRNFTLCTDFSFSAFCENTIDIVKVIHDALQTLRYLNRDTFSQRDTVLSEKKCEGKCFYEWRNVLLTPPLPVFLYLRHIFRHFSLAFCQMKNWRQKRCFASTFLIRIFRIPRLRLEIPDGPPSLRRPLWVWLDRVAPWISC